MREGRLGPRPVSGYWLCGCRAVVLLAACAAAPAQAEGFLHEPAVQRFIDEMTHRHAFAEAELQGLFRESRPLPSVIEAITQPAEAKPWYEYRPIFLTADRIQGGIGFRRRHREALERAERTYGVPAEVTAAIIGVETLYGRYTGRYPVFEALATLAFQYPKRSDFFRSELEQFLLMCREEGIDPRIPTGSYAGAMGLPQFIASSYRRFAVDFDGDGRRDLWNSPVDAIGSVANYLGEHGWSRGEAVVLPTRVGNAGVSGMLARGLKPHTPLAELQELGLSIPAQEPPDRLASLLRLELRDGYEYWIALQNFYTITLYNHSARYAMAVYQLAEAIQSGDILASL
jgi:membrane-bound lytic murein transglycosylase B